MGCGCSTKKEPQNVIRPISLAQANFVGSSGPAKVSAEASPNHTSRGRDMSISSASDVRATPKHLGTLDVLCWCSDPDILHALELEPPVQYTCEKTAQTVVFNRVSALNPRSVSLPAMAVVYLVTSQTDVSLLKRTYAAFQHIWNHFIVADSADFEVPKELPIPVLRQNHDLHMEMHACYMDQLAVVEAYLARSAPALEKRPEADVFLREMTCNLSLDLVSLREFWVQNRMRLWLLKEGIAKHISQGTTYVQQLLLTASSCMRTSVDATEGNLHFTFGDTGEVYKSQASLHLGTLATMEHISLPTVSLIKYLDKACWVCLSLRPNPECGATIDNMLLSQLAKATYENIIRHDPTVADLFGYDLHFWLAINHTRIRDNPEFASFLTVLNQIKRVQELKVSYKTTLSVTDFMLRSSENIGTLLLEHAVIALKWSLTVPVWKLVSDSLSRFGDWLSTACLFSDVDMSFDSASNELFPETWKIEPLLARLISEIRQPVESSPSLMKQLHTSLDFYQPLVKVVGRIAQLGLELSVELPNLSDLLLHHKAHSFL